MRSQSPPNRRRIQAPGGFTLIEAMVSIAILTVLAALAVPAFRTVTERMKVSTVSDEMVAALNLTRGTAIQNNGNVTLRKLSNAEAGLTGVCNTTQDWSCGWRVFRDTDGNGVLDAGEEVIYTFNITNRVTVMRFTNGVSMTANRWGQLTGINAVRFTLLPTDTGVTSPAVTTICLNSGGRVRVLEGHIAC
ncbi:MAG: GspH/FimT family pseudopilin [Burkholderiaceae bacterium]